MEKQTRPLGRWHQNQIKPKVKCPQTREKRGNSPERAGGEHYGKDSVDWIWATGKKVVKVEARNAGGPYLQRGLG